MRGRGRLALPLAVAMVSTAVAVTASVASDSTSLPALVPAASTPNINDADGNTVLAVTHVGTRIIVGGLFQSATNSGTTSPVYTRGNILAFDATTGLVDTGFAPALDGEVHTLLPGPAPDTIYVGGQFTHVGTASRARLVELSTVTGAVVTTFKPPTINNTVADIATSHGHLILGGTFTKIGTTTRGGLASLNPTTGALDSFLTAALAGHHNWTSGSTGAKALTGVERLDVSPDGNQLAVVGNFKTVGGAAHDQGVLIDLSKTTAAVLPWYAPGLTATCNAKAFDDWVRDVAFGPDGSYFVIVGTGGPSTATSLCDASERFNTSDASNKSSQPQWIDHSGGDTFLSVATTSAGVYVGGHFRWLNNSTGHDSAAAGAVARPGIAALDPRSGIPLAWNPGHHPRGFGIQALYVDTTGLYVGSDMDYFGYFQYQRAKIGFLPFAGGYTPTPGQVATLPAKIYQTGVQAPVQSVLYRVDAGGPQIYATDGGPDWAADTGATSPYHGSGGSTTSYANQITNTDPSLPAGTPLGLFSSIRYGATASPYMKWSFPVGAGVSVSVRLFYADRAFPAYTTGQRVFSVTIDNTVVEPSMDIVGSFGYNTAGMKSYPVTSDGNVDITFTPSADSPEIAAIEIVRNSVGTDTGIGARTFSGTTAGALTPVGGADGTPWASMRGAMLIDGQLYYGMTDGNLYTRTFDGTTVGPPSIVNPFNDPLWDGRTTGSGTSVYTGVKSSFYPEIATLAAMYYNGGGKIYYTRTGQTKLFWRWFSPDSKITGADEFTVATSASFANASGVLFMSGAYLYYSTTNGNLDRIGWTGTTTSGTATVVSGPAVDGQNWASNGAFIGH